MKAHRIICLFFALGTAAVALAADPTGTWKWTTRLPNGDIETTLKLESTDGKLAGAYSNQFGDTAISNLSLQDDVIAFDVVDRKSTRLNSSHLVISYAVFCLKKKTTHTHKERLQSLTSTSRGRTDTTVTA